MDKQLVSADSNVKKYKDYLDKRSDLSDEITALQEPSGTCKFTRCKSYGV